MRIVGNPHLVKKNPTPPFLTLTLKKQGCRIFREYLVYHGSRKSSQKNPHMRILQYHPNILNGGVCFYANIFNLEYIISLKI